MAFNGAGVFTRLYNWVTDAANSINITASRMDEDTQDIVDGLSNCICKDGQTTITADIPFSDNKITGLGDATDAQDAVNLRTLQTSIIQWAGSSGGSSTVMTLAPTTAIAAYAAGQRFTFLNTNANTSATPTMNISGVGAKNIKKTIGKSLVNLSVGDMPANTICDIAYDGTQFQLMNVRSHGQGADIASASTVNLDTATGDYVNITGTTAITAVTLSQGREVTVKFAGILTFTNGASLINISGANITTAAGDTCVLRGEASSVVRMIDYTRADGTPLISSNSYRGAVVYNSADQTISASTFTALTFDTEAIDTDSIHSTSSNTSRMTVPSGVTKVRLVGQCVMDNTGANTYRELRIYKNGSLVTGPTLRSSFTTGDGSSNSVWRIVSPAVTCTSGDYFELFVYHTSSGSLSAYSNATWFEMQVLA